MRVLYLATTICVLSVSILAAEFSSELKNEPLTNTELQTVKIREQFMIEQYLGDNEGLESLIGYYYDYYDYYYDECASVEGIH